MLKKAKWVNVLAVFIAILVSPHTSSVCFSSPVQEEKIDANFWSLVQKVSSGNPLGSSALPQKNFFSVAGCNLMLVAVLNHEVQPTLIVTGIAPRFDSRKKAQMETTLKCPVLDIFDFVMPENYEGYSKAQMRDILISCSVLHEGASKLIFSKVKKLSSSSDSLFLKNFKPREIRSLLKVLELVKHLNNNETNLLKACERCLINIDEKDLCKECKGGGTCDTCSQLKTSLEYKDLASGDLQSLEQYRNTTINELATEILKLFLDNLKNHFEALQEITSTSQFHEKADFAVSFELFFKNVDKALDLMERNEPIDLIGKICSRSRSANPGLAKVGDGLKKAGINNQWFSINDREIIDNGKSPGQGLNKPSAALERALHSEVIAGFWIEQRARDSKEIYPFMFTQRDMCPTCNVFLPTMLIRFGVRNIHILSFIEANNPNDPYATLVENFYPWYAPFILEKTSFSSDYAVDIKNVTIADSILSFIPQKPFYAENQIYRIRFSSPFSSCWSPPPITTIRPPTTISPPITSHDGFLEQ